MAMRILIYEDNALLRESMVSLLSLHEKFSTIQAFEQVVHVREQLAAFHPDIILMDIDMPGMTGIEGLKQIRSLHPELPVLMLTVFDDNTHVFDAIRAGASGYLLKKHISSRLYEAIEDALSGGAPMSPSIARMVISSMQEPMLENPYQLTQREREILTSLSKGNSYKMIASELGISLDTVRTHIKRIYEKLHVHSQTEAVSKAINEKLV